MPTDRQGLTRQVAGTPRRGLCAQRAGSTFCVALDHGQLAPSLSAAIIRYDANHRSRLPPHASTHHMAEPFNRDGSCPQVRFSTAPLAERHATFLLTPRASLYRLALARYYRVIYAICSLHWHTGGRADEVDEHLPILQSSSDAWPLYSIPLPGEAPTPDSCLAPSRREGLRLFRPPPTSKSTPAVADA
jgi:hypothetical protein